jgi:hypothetical protein
VLSLPEEDLTLDLTGIQFQALLPMGPIGSEAIKGNAAVARGTVVSPKGTVDGLSLSSELIFDPSTQTLRVESMEFRSGDARALIPIDMPEPLGLLFQTTASADLKEKKINKGVFNVDLNWPSSKLNLRGQMNASWDEAVRASIESLECSFNPKELLRVLPKKMTKGLSPFDIQGDISISGSVKARLLDQTPRIEPNLSLHLDNNRIRMDLPSFKADTRLSGKVHLEGPWPDSYVTASLDAQKILVDHHALKASPAKAKIRVEGAINKLELKELDLRTPELHIGDPKGGLAFEEVRVRADEGTIEPMNGRLKIPRVQAAFKGIRPLNISLEHKQGISDFQITGKDTGLPAFLSGQNRPLSDWNIQGKDDLKLNASIKGNGSLSFSSRLKIEGLALENGELEAYGEGISTTVEVQGVMKEGGNDLSCTSVIKASSGELLLDQFYFNLGKTPATISMKGKTGKQKNEILLTEINAALTDLVSINLSGKLRAAQESPYVKISASLPTFELEPVFKHFIAEPFRIKKPILDKISAKGNTSGTVDLEVNGEDIEIQGFIRIKEGTVSSEEPAVSLDGVDLNLPIWFKKNGPQSPSIRNPKTGRLSIRSVKAPRLPEQAVSLDFQTTPNGMLIKGPTQILIPGGGFQIGDILLKLHPLKGLLAETSLTVEDLALHPLLSQLWPGSPKGAIKGSLNPIVYREGEVKSRGEFTAEVFDGTVSIRNVCLPRLPASSPVVGFDAQWEGLNLEKITRGTKFGLVTGTLVGRIKGFELAYGQPQKFDLLMETRPREGVAQRVSVEAIENISRIGGGGSPFVGMAGFFTSFFSEFPYEKIGVHATLENDMFRINGTVHDNETEYIIKRSGISGVNVVNQNPDNKISFKDMIKRVQRVFASRGGPVIR